jgi:hypothetical protein
LEPTVTELASMAAAFQEEWIRDFYSFTTDPAERWIFGCTVDGRVATIDLDRMELLHETQLVPAPIEAIECHPRLPYLAVMTGDHRVTVARVDASGQLSPVHRIDLRTIRSERYPGKEMTHPTTSMALAFHPDEPRLLLKTRSSAVAEVGFDDQRWDVRWCEGYFARPEADTVSEVASLRYLAGSNHVLATSGEGDLVVIDPAAPREPLLRWKYPRGAIHNAEHVEGSDYLLSTDGRRLIRFDASGARPPVIGEIFAMNHLEVVRYHRPSGRAFAAGFDRRIYELDPVTLRCKRVVAKLPFLCRFLRTLDRAPDVLIAECRSGGLYRIDLQSREVRTLKETPPGFHAVVASSPTRAWLMGEGSEIVELSIGSGGKCGRTSFAARHFETGCLPSEYTRRLATDPATGDLLIARSDGEVRRFDPKTGSSRSIAELGAEIRDFAVDPEGKFAYAGCEDGRAYKIDLTEDQVAATFQTPGEHPPIWALAYNPERRLLVVAPFLGPVHLLDADDFSEVGRIDANTSPKRARWIDGDRLLLVRGSIIQSIDFRTGEQSLVAEEQNTIEDFQWDPTRRFLAVITFDRAVALYDCETGRRLHSVRAGMGPYTELLWLDRRSPDAYPYELLVVGWEGLAYRFRVHNEQLCPMGVAAHAPPAPHRNDAVSVY